MLSLYIAYQLCTSNFFQSIFVTHKHTHICIKVDIYRYILAIRWVSHWCGGQRCVWMSPPSSSSTSRCCKVSFGFPFSIERNSRRFFIIQNVSKPKLLCLPSVHYLNNHRRLADIPIFACNQEPHSIPGSFLVHDLETIHQLVKGMNTESESNETNMATKFRFLDDPSRVVWNDKIQQALKQIRERTLTQLAYDEACMMISPEQGKFLSFLVRAIGARHCLELGTFTGYSSVCIAAGMIEKADSVLYCLECNENYARMAEQGWTSANLEHKIHLVLGDAGTSLQRLLVDKRGWFDFVFIDADKERYREYYETALDLLRVGGVVCIDDTWWSGRVVNEEEYRDAETLGIRQVLELMQRDARVFACSIPIFDGMAVAYKLETKPTHHDANPFVLSQLLNHKLVDVEGNIAVGKTHLVQGFLSMWKEEEENKRMPRVFEENPNSTFLAAFYKQPQVFGFSFQMYMLQLAQQVATGAKDYLLRGASSDDIVVALIDRSLWGNRVFAQCNFHLGNLQEEEYQIYRSVYEQVEFQPDYLIYLDASPWICFERAKMRGRPAEAALQLSYLEALDDCHFQQLISTVCQGKVNVVVVNAHTFCTPQQVTEKIVRNSKSPLEIRFEDQDHQGGNWFLCALDQDCYVQMAKGATDEEWLQLLRRWLPKNQPTMDRICLPWISNHPHQVPNYVYQAYKRLVCFALSSHIAIEFHGKAT